MPQLYKLLLRNYVLVTINGVYLLKLLVVVLVRRRILTSASTQTFFTYYAFFLKDCETNSFPVLTCAFSWNPNIIVLFTVIPSSSWDPLIPWNNFLPLTTTALVGDLYVVMIFAHMKSFSLCSMLMAPSSTPTRLIN